MKNIKQVLVLRRDLGMRRGKECAQVAHASMAWLTQRLTTLHDGGRPGVAPNDEWNPLGLSPHEMAWVTGLFTKVVCQVPNEIALLDVYQRARDAGLEAHLIIDSGKTEFGGIPTSTAVGIGPDEAAKIDVVTGELKLY